MNATINYNKEHGGIEITFDSKPSEAIRAELKTAGFRWHNTRRVWYAKNTGDAQTIAAALGNGEAIPATVETATPPKTRCKVDREALKAEFVKVWHDSKRIIDYCTNKVFNTVTMNDGTIITIDKEPIETRFCYGEDGYDYDEAAASAQHARTSCEHLKRENMRKFDEYIASIDGAATFDGRYILTYRNKTYTGQDDDCKLGYITFRRIVDILEDVGGSACLSGLAGQTLSERGSGAMYHVMTSDEIARLRDAYEAARAAHEKKVDAYIKRYGTSKVHAWTYWREA